MVAAWAGGGQFPWLQKGIEATYLITVAEMPLAPGVKPFLHTLATRLPCPHCLVHPS